MNFKPSDLFLGVIDFFGILIPGAVLFYFHGVSFFHWMGMNSGQIKGIDYWFLSLTVSYILGHFLLGGSVWMNKISIQWLSIETKKYFRDIKELVILPSEISSEISSQKDDKDKIKNINEVYYSTFSYLRLNSPEAMSELEKQAAEYKLFRSLCLLFLVDSLFLVMDMFCNNFLLESFPFSRLIVSLLLFAITFWRFDFLFDWTYRLAFDFFLQIQKTKTAEKSGT